MTDNEIIKALNEADGINEVGIYCADREGEYIATVKVSDVVDLINRQKAEIERLEAEVSKARRKALLEAKGKFAGHSDYHGDTILCKLICMAEGKEVGVAKPLNKSKIKSEAIKEFAKKLVAIYENDKTYDRPNAHTLVMTLFRNIDNLVKEMENKP